jgi:hypothetical protein
VEKGLAMNVTELAAKKREPLSDLIDQNIHQVRVAKWMQEANLPLNKAGRYIITRSGIYHLKSEEQEDDDRDPRVVGGSYWAIQAQDKLLPGHNDFFQDDFYAIATALIRMTETDIRQRPPLTATTLTVAGESIP